jgi:hypothetical protein
MKLRNSSKGLCEAGLRSAVAFTNMLSTVRQLQIVETGRVNRVMIHCELGTLFRPRVKSFKCKIWVFFYNYVRTAGDDQMSTHCGLLARPAAE